MRCCAWWTIDDKLFWRTTIPRCQGVLRQPQIPIRQCKSLRISLGATGVRTFGILLRLKLRKNQGWPKWRPMTNWHKWKPWVCGQWAYRNGDGEQQLRSSVQWKCQLYRTNSSDPTQSSTDNEPTQKICCQRLQQAKWRFSDELNAGKNRNGYVRRRQVHKQIVDWFLHRLVEKDNQDDPSITHQVNSYQYWVGQRQTKVQGVVHLYSTWQGIR